MAKVTFVPQNIEMELSPERTLLQGALDKQVDIKSICKGKLICAECRVKIVEGDQNCVPPSSAELGVLGSAWHLEGQRLACQVRCFGDIKVDLTEQIKRDETNKKKIRGYKSNRPVSESKAVIDTMILAEKIEETALPAEGSGGQRTEFSSSERRQRDESQGGEGRSGRNRNRNRNRGQGGGGRGSQGEGRGKGGGGQGPRGGKPEPKS